MRADALSRKPGHAGAIAFSRTGDPSSGDFSNARLIRKFGDVPDHLSMYFGIELGTPGWSPATN
jgi:hypothetical protein